MRISSPSSRVLKLPLILLLAAAVVPFDAAPADAARFKFRYRSNVAAKQADKADEQARPPVRIRIGRSSGSDSAEDKDEKGRPRPVGAAARAAARAQAALEAEKAKSASSVRVYQPIPAGQTTDYAGGVACVAGC